MAIIKLEELYKENVWFKDTQIASANILPLHQQVLKAGRQGCNGLDTVREDQVFWLINLDLRDHLAGVSTFLPII